MFLRATTRKKDGKEHRYYSVVENVRRPGRRTPFQKTILYLGEINDRQQAAWRKEGASAVLLGDAKDVVFAPLSRRMLGDRIKTLRARLDGGSGL